MHRGTILLIVISNPSGLMGPGPHCGHWCHIPWSSSGDFSLVGLSEPSGLL